MEQLLRHRRGEEIKDKDLENLRQELVDILDSLGAPLPLRGKMLGRILTKRPGQILRRFGVTEFVDNVLQFLLEITTEACKKELDNRLTQHVWSDYHELPVDPSYRGYVYETLGRAWLRDVVGGPWDDLDYWIGVGKGNGQRVYEIDAVSTQRIGHKLLVYVAEIVTNERRLEPVKLDESAKAYASQVLSVRKDIREVNFGEIRFIIFSYLKDRESLFEKVRQRLSFEASVVKVDDLSSIEATCKANERRGSQLLKAINYVVNLDNQTRK